MHVSVQIACMHIQRQDLIWCIRRVGQFDDPCSCNTHVNFRLDHSMGPKLSRIVVRLEVVLAMIEGCSFEDRATPAALIPCTSACCTALQLIDMQ